MKPNHTQLTICYVVITSWSELKDDGLWDNNINQQSVIYKVIPSIPMCVCVSVCVSVCMHVHMCYYVHVHTSLNSYTHKYMGTVS